MGARTRKKAFNDTGDRIDNKLILRDKVVEATVTAMSKLKDARAIPALRKAAAGVYDYFLKLTIAEAQLNVADTEGYSTLIGILSEDDAGYARHQANQLFESRSDGKFGYNPDLPVAANSP